MLDSKDQILHRDELRLDASPSLPPLTVRQPPVRALIGQSTNTSDTSVINHVHHRHRHRHYLTNDNHDNQYNQDSHENHNVHNNSPNDHKNPSNPNNSNQNVNNVNNNNNNNNLMNKSKPQSTSKSLTTSNDKLTTKRQVLLFSQCSHHFMSVLDRHISAKTQEDNEFGEC